MTKKHRMILLPLFSLVLLLAACTAAPADGPVPSPGATSEAVLEALEEPISTPEPAQTPEPTPEPTPTPMPRVTLMALGDDLLHMGIVGSGRQADGSYNFDFLFEDLAEFIELADISVINQETIFGGNELGFSGYPRFNSPEEVGDAIVNAGFNVVLQATNHTADQKLEGMENCIAYWKEHPEVLMAGLHDPYDEAATAPDRVRTLTVNDITFAILNYTYGPNAEILPSYTKTRLDILCDWDKKSGRINFTRLNPQVIEDITAAKELADVVIVFPHWGVEYATTPSRYQKEWALQMAEAGADLIIGTHPHVIQPVEWITTQDGSETLCYYSLGNYVSTQKDPISMLENMAWVTFQATQDGVVIDREATGSIPLVCQYKAGPLRFDAVYLLEEYSQELADTHGIRSWGPHNLYYDELRQWADEILGDSVKPAYELTGLRKKESSW